MTGTLQDRLDRLPARPGVYIYHGPDGEVLYVGKAKSLRSRVRSYFRPGARHPPKTARLVREIADLEVLVVDTEREALILEANLIKKNRPRFNVILRDDKQFPYLKLSAGDTYPRVTLVRRVRRDSSVYFGPFTPASIAHRSLKLIPKIFRVATCKEVFDGKRRPCLYYHLDQCLAPCAGKTDPVEYGDAVREARLFLEGRHHDLKEVLKERMGRCSKRMEYERAARYRDTIRTLDELGVRQHMSSVGLEKQDYLAWYREGDQVALQLFQMREGKIESRREFVFEEVDGDAGRFLSAVLAQYYLSAQPPPEIYVMAPPDGQELLAGWLGERRGGPVRLKVPIRGVRKRFMDLVLKNARLAFENRFRSGHDREAEILEALSDLLEMDRPPYRIECFDISNIQGTDTVASMVVWEGGKPSRKDYRSYNIRTVKGVDDFASMAEAVTRRYRRLLKEDRRLPDLVIIDGGPGQLGAAVRAAAEVGLPMMKIISLAKRDEEIFTGSGQQPIRLAKSSPVLQLVQRIRDEAHRFAVTRHRARRKRRTLRSGLTDIPGVGPVTARKLLRTFGSLRAVKAAGREELSGVVGRKTAGRIREYYREGPV